MLRRPMQPAGLPGREEPLYEGMTSLALSRKLLHATPPPPPTPPTHPPTHTHTQTPHPPPPPPHPPTSQPDCACRAIQVQMFAHCLFDWVDLKILMSHWTGLEFQGGLLVVLKRFGFRWAFVVATAALAVCLPFFQVRLQGCRPFRSSSPCGAHARRGVKLSLGICTAACRPVVPSCPGALCV
jgi:hypothetical protein